MPKSTFVDIPTEEQAQMLAALRRARYGYLLALHILLLCAAGTHPDGHRRRPVLLALQCVPHGAGLSGRAPWAWSTTTMGGSVPPCAPPCWSPTLRRSLLALLKAPPRAYGWCRTRWSCATLALTLQAKRGITVSAETMRRWLHEVGWVWKRAKLVAKDDDPQRVDRLARIRVTFEQLSASEAMVFADELDIHLLPKGGLCLDAQRDPTGGHDAGTNEKHYLAGALDLATGTLLHCCRAAQNQRAVPRPAHPS